MGVGVGVEVVDGAGVRVEDGEDVAGGVDEVEVEDEVEEGVEATDGVEGVGELVGVADEVGSADDDDVLDWGAKTLPIRPPTSRDTPSEADTPAVGALELEVV